MKDCLASASPGWPRIERRIIPHRVAGQSTQSRRPRPVADDFTSRGHNPPRAAQARPRPTSRGGQRGEGRKGGRRDELLLVGVGRAAGGRRLLRLPRPLPDPVPGKLLPLVLWQVPLPLPSCSPTLSPFGRFAIFIHFNSSAPREIQSIRSATENCQLLG